MAAFLNTGILGQVTGGSLGVGQLNNTFRSFRDRVKANKRTRRGVSDAERVAVAKRREERLAESEKTTGVTGGIDTHDVTPHGPGADATKGITTSVPPVTSGPSQNDLAPELNYTEAEGAFIRSLSDWNQHIMGKNNSDINKGARQTQGYLTNVQELAKATGRSELVDAIGGIEGVLGQNHISSRNVGQAKASTNKALSTVRGHLDIERIMQQLDSAPAAAAPKVTSGKRKIASAKLKTTNRAKVFTPWGEFS